MTILDGGIPARARGGPTPGHILWLGLAAALACLFAANAAVNHRIMQEQIAEARAWTITAPPCPVFTHEAYLANARTNHMQVAMTFHFIGVGFGRAYGHVSCAGIRDDGGRGPGIFPVCQFTSPGVLEITTPRRVVYFFPQASRATVSVPHGEPRCVLASKFNGWTGG